jgi:IS605 OrfB family transposase
MFEKIINSFNLDNDYSKFIFLEYFFIKNKLNNDFRFNLDIYSDMVNINMENIIYIVPSDFYKIIITNLNPIIPFWNSKIKNISDTLFLPTFDNIEKLSTSKTFNCNKNYITEHYKSKILQKNIEYNKERKFIATNSKNNIRARKVKIFLNKDQRNCIKKIFGIYRYFYNRAIQFINNYSKDLNSTSILIDNYDIFSRISFKFDNTDNIFSMNNMRKYLKNNIPEWLDLKIPSHLIDQSFSEASNNYYKCMKKYKKNHKPFTLKFKTKKDVYQTINIEKCMISKDKKSIFKNLKFNDKKVFEKINFSENIYGFNILDSSISCNTRLNIYYLNINYKNKEKADKEILKNNKICSIDPGNRTFLSIYSDNEVNMIGTGILNKIGKICKEIDILNSKINKKKKEYKSEYKYNKNKRRNYKKAMFRKIEYLKNIKKDLHNKSIKYLCDNYSKIITAPFEIQEMSQKFNNKISRNMYCLSYYSFLSKLKKRCERYDIELQIKNESYTSKTCTKCGNIKYNLGSNKIYNCNICKISIDRDINGARNIMLKNNVW